VSSKSIFKPQGKTEAHLAHPCPRCAETSVAKRLSAVTRALFAAVSGGKKQIAKVSFFDSFLDKQERLPEKF